MKELVEKIKKTQKNAAIEPILFPANVRPGWEGKKRKAKEDLPELQAKYKVKIKDKILGIFAVGEKAKEFSDVCIKDYKLYSAGAEDIFDRVVKAVKKTISYGKVFTSEQVLYANFEVEKIAKEMEVFASIPLLTMEARLSKAVHDENDLKSILKKLIRKTYGYDLEYFYLVHQIASQALRDLSASSLVPVVITGAEDCLLENVTTFKRGSYIINTGKEVREDAFGKIEDDIDKKSVGQILATIKENLKK